MRVLFARALRRLLPPAAAFLITCGCQAGAQADPLVLTLTNPTQTVAPGAAFTFIGSVTNTGAASPDTDTLTGANIQFAPTPTIVAVDFISTFNANFLDRTVPIGATLDPLPVVTVIPLDAAPLGSVYTGSLTLLYTGAQGETLSTNSVNFTVTVDSPTAPVPEPSTMLLLGTGLVGIAVKARRRSKASHG